MFRFTERYVKKKKVQMYSTLILFPILLGLSVPIAGFNWHRGKSVPILWVFYIFTLIFYLLKYGANRVYGNDIHIQNNRIYYYLTHRGPRGVTFGSYVFQAIKKVEVKKSKIVVYGHIFEETGFGHVFKKFTLPKEIENVDEFIRIARSLVGKE